MSGVGNRTGARAVVVATLAALLLVVGAEAAPSAACVGDCNGDGEVRINELVIMVNLDLDGGSVSICLAADVSGDGVITMDEIVLAVNRALYGCLGDATPTPTVAPCTTQSCRQCTAADASGLCLSGPAGMYCCTLTDPPGFFDLANCDFTGNYPSGCWQPQPGGTPGSCYTQAVCQVPSGNATPTASPSAATATATASLPPSASATATDTTTPGPSATATDSPSPGPATSTPTVTPPGPSPTPTVAGGCTAQSCQACTAADTKCAGAPSGDYCCTLNGGLFQTFTNCNGTGDYPSGCWQPSPGTCYGAAVCLVPTATPTMACATATPAAPTATASATPTGPTPTPTDRCSTTPPATPTPGGACRMLEVVNDGADAIWIGAIGGAVEPTCFDQCDTPSVCLVVPAYANSDGACACSAHDSQMSGALKCPATGAPVYDAGTGAWTCQCTTDADCGAGAACGTVGNCFWTVPAPVTHGTSSNVWELLHNETASFCLPEPPTINGVTSPVWWGGGIFARTSCLDDGTECATADCDACANAACPAGGTANKPFSQAEFTLSTAGNDFYDVTIINGANLALEMGPLPSPTAPPVTVLAGTPTPTPNPYWCGVPGSASPPTALEACSWEFNAQSIAVVPAPGQALLLQSYLPCNTTQQPNGCPTPATSASASSEAAGAAPTPTPVYGAWFCTSGTASNPIGQCIVPCTSNADCSGTDLPECNTTSGLCECGDDDDCPAGQFCGTQFLNGKVPGLAKLCGTFVGWWTADDICGSGVLGTSGSYGPLDCTASITDGDGSTDTTLTDLFGCTGSNAASCYNTSSSNSNCCGCATWPTPAANPLGSDWPPQTTLQCDAQNPTWASAAQPWLGYLKKSCPTAYTYPYDDSTSTFTCQGPGNPNLLGYRITFRSLPTPERVGPTPTPTP